MRVTIKISGNPVAAIQSKVANFKTRANAAVQFAGLNCESLAKQNCPVDTGLLRSSIKYTKTGENSCTCGTSVKYAPDIEFGHKTRLGTGHSKPRAGHMKAFVAPRPFLMPAKEQAGKQLLQDLRAIK